MVEYDRRVRISDMVADVKSRKPAWAIEYRRLFIGYDWFARPVFEGDGVPSALRVNGFALTQAGVVRKAARLITELDGPEFERLCEVRG